MKINNYIKYLLILILLQGINIYAQASNLNQIISQAQQEASSLSPFFNLSSIINTPIIKYLATTLGSSFLGFAIPFLFVFGVLTFITYENKKEINRPLLLIYFIIDLLLTIFFPAILILLAIILAILLLLFGFYKLFRTLTGSTIGGIAGAIITAFIFFGILLRFINNSITRFLALTFLILLSILFLILTIYAFLKIKNEPSTDNIKKLIYHIHTPQDARNLQNILRKTVGHFNNSINQIRGEFKNLVNTLRTNYLGQQQPPRNIGDLIDLLRKIRDNINDFINEYEKYKMDLDQIEASINSRYKEPLRSYLLKILEEGKKEIEKIAEDAYQEYLKRYQILRTNRPTIKNLALSRKYKITIDKIFNEMESLIHSFQI